MQQPFTFFIIGGRGQRERGLVSNISLVDGDGEKEVWCLTYHWWTGTERKRSGV